MLGKRTDAVKSTLIMMQLLFFGCVIMSVLTRAKCEKFTSYSSIIHYVQLASDIQSNYRSSSVFVVNTGHYEDLGETILMTQIIKEFSRKYVLSQNINFTMLDHQVSYYNGKSVQPLFVIMLSSMDDVQQFATTTKFYNMNLHTWLLIFMPSTDERLDKLCRHPQKNIFNLLISSKILVKCDTHSMIREWYSVDKINMLVMDYGWWQSSVGLRRLSKDYFYKRRSDFKGISLKFSAVKDAPIISGINGTINGFFGGLLKELSKKMNFTYELTSIEDSYGSSVSGTKNWTGVIGRLIERKIDIGIGEFTMSRQRVPIIDYTTPVMLTYSDMYIRRPNMSNVHWSTYVKAFDKDIWIIIVIMLLIIPILLAMMWTANKGSDITYFLVEEYLRIWGIYCQKPLEDFPSGLSLRIAYISLFTSALVLYAVYLAYLTSYRTVFTPYIPFNTFEGFIDDGTYRLSVIPNSSNYDLFKRPEISIFSAMGKLLMNKEDLPTDVFSAIKQVCNERVVLFTNQLFIEKISRYSPCELMSLTQGRLDNVGIALVKDSPYTEIINYNLKILRSYGISERLRRRYFRKFIYTESSYLPVTFWEIVPAVGILFLGFVISLHLLLCEYLYFYQPQFFYKRIIGLKERNDIKITIISDMDKIENKT